MAEARLFSDVLKGEVPPSQVIHPLSVLGDAVNYERITSTFDARIVPSRLERHHSFFPELRSLIRLLIDEILCC